MLVLCSNGLSSDMLLAQLSGKMADCKTAALVVCAAVYRGGSHDMAAGLADIEQREEVCRLSA